MIEEVINSFDYVVQLKEKGMITWEEIFPSFYSVAKNNFKTIKENGLLEDVKKILTYIKPLKTLPEKRKERRLEGLRDSLKILKERYLIDEVSVEPEKKLAPLTDIKYIKKVGTKRALVLNRLGIFSLKDFFYYPPRDYEDRRKVVKIFNAKEDEKVVIIGNVVKSEEAKINKGLTIYNFSVEDDTGVIIVTFFNQDYVKSFLKRGVKSAFYGKIEYSYGMKQMKSPDFQVIENEEDFKREILPVYPLTSGIFQTTMRKIAKEVIKQTYFLEEFLPEEFVQGFNLLDLKKRIKGIHFPLSIYHKERAWYSLKYEEAILFELAMIYLKLKMKEMKKGATKEIKGELSKNFLNTLNFELTQAQKRSYEEIKKDLISPYPMNRLLQGDVGSGKTVVSELAIIDVCEAGYQAAVMNPTSVLSKQQFKRLSNDLEPLGLKVALLTGDTKESDKILIKEKLRVGEIDVVVGTHAIIQQDVEFKKLGLVVIDEQHRFGVNQRLELIKKGNHPDILVMTATPIPRTLAMTFYGDLDVSLIDEVPKGRRPIKTILVAESNRKSLYEFVKEELDQGNQVFFVYPLIEESEALELKNAMSMYEELSEVFKEYKVGLLHGRLSPSEKNEVMDKFVQREYDILVSTSVVEVGIDIPDATVMVIEHPDRFGLSQLHQLRGRVGRSEKQSYCFLVLDDDANNEIKSKMNSFSKTLDGFEVAEIDLKWRGPGKFFGVEQHGVPEFKFLDLAEDVNIIESSRKMVERFLSSIQSFDRYPNLKHELQTRYGDSIHLINVL